MLQEVLAQLNWRSAIKSYDSSKKLNDEQVETLIETARLAPSSFGVQPVRLYVVSDQKVKDQLKVAGYGQPQLSEASHVFVLAARKTITEADMIEFVERTAKQRSLDVANLGDFQSMLLGSIGGKTSQQLHDWSAKQAYLALGMMLAVASAHKIDTSPMEGFSSTEFDTILEIDKDGYKSVVIMCAGFRMAGEKYSSLPKVRKTKAEFVKMI